MRAAARGSGPEAAADYGGELLLDIGGPSLRLSLDAGYGLPEGSGIASLGGDTGEVEQGCEIAGLLFPSAARRSAA